MEIDYFEPVALRRSSDKIDDPTNRIKKQKKNSPLECIDQGIFISRIFLTI